jgi:hypothetical protein
MLGRLRRAIAVAAIFTAAIVLITVLWLVMGHCIPLCRTGALPASDEVRQRPRVVNKCFQSGNRF